MKWNISRDMVRLIPFERLITWDIKIWKKVKAQGRNIILNEWFEIDNCSTINNGIMVYSNRNFPVKIWKFCSIGAWTTFISSMNHDYGCLTTHTRTLWKSINHIWWAIILWNDVRVWRNVIILKWVTIWTWAVIWAWAVVTKDIPPYAIAVWNPAKIIKYRFDEETIEKLLASEWRNWDLEKIKQNYNLEFLKNS